MKKMRDHIYRTEELVIGGSLEAAMYAYTRRTNLLYTQSEHQRFFEFLDPSVDLRQLNLENGISRLPSPEGIKVLGTMKKIIWSEIVLRLNLLGKIFASHRSVSIRVESDNLVKISMVGGRTISIQPERIKIFHPCNVSGLEHLLVSSGGDQIIVYDWLSYNLIKMPKFWYFEPKGKVLKKFFLYKNTRSHDLVAISNFESSQLDDPNYGDMSTKFDILDTFDSYGISYNEANLKPRLREAFPLANSRYESTENIEFLDLSVQEILRDYKKEEQPYFWKLVEKYLGKQDEI